MNIRILSRSFPLVTCLLLSLFVAADSYACSCGPYPNQSLCQLGDEANTPGGRANFMAVVELGDSTVSGEFTKYTVTIIEFLAGTEPVEDITLVQYGLGWSCTQYEFIEPGAKGVLMGQVTDGELYPSFCTLQHSFFRMAEDTVFVPLYGEDYRNIDQPYTLTDFYNEDCVEVSKASEVLSPDEDFSFSYDVSSNAFQVLVRDPSMRSPTLRVTIYSSSGQHLLEARQSVPIDMSSFPPGMYAILIRNEQQAWSKAFVKPN